MNPPPARPASKRPLYWLLAICLAPFIGSVVLYLWLPPGKLLNYGTLLENRTVAGLPVQGLDGAPVQEATLRGHWVLVVVDAAACGQACVAKLYATRQARTMQGKERERVVRLWLVTDGGAPSAELLAQHPELVVARADQAWVNALKDDPAGAIWLVDPLGNLILRYPADPDIKRLHKDLSRLLYASRIG